MALKKSVIFQLRQFPKGLRDEGYLLAAILVAGSNKSFIHKGGYGKLNTVCLLQICWIYFLCNYTHTLTHTHKNRATTFLIVFLCQLIPFINTLSFSLLYIFYRYCASSSLFYVS